MSAYKHANSDPLEELKRFKNPNIIRCLIRELYTENSYTYKKLQTENRKIKTLIKKITFSNEEIKFRYSYYF